MPCNSDCRKPHGRQAHCGVCHKTFSGVYPFDAHRQQGQCVITADVTERDRVWGRWGSRQGVTWWR